ncbi:MAG: OmpH family outer membrane protein [Bacteroidaceae bacterium]|nr:OmpH family outer membrane protein [Bacteroidaceae bacterium]
MKRNQNIITTLCAAAFVLTFAQCNNAPQQTAVTPAVTCDSARALKIAYVDIDTLLTNYNLWIELNETMISKEEDVRATLNEKAKSLQSDYEEFERKLNNNAFATRERAEAEQNRILKKREELEQLQERLTNELAIENNKNSLLFRDSINAYIRDYNKEHGYNIILSRIGDNILYIDNAMNITQDIIDGLNARHAKYGNKKK